MKKVEIYTDGACSGNPGPGGWGAVLVYGGHEKELCGGEAETTNNRMELTAVIEALSALREPCEVTLTSDSKYVVDALTLGWAEGWRARGWRKADKSPALNADLWARLLELTHIHRVSCVWVNFRIVKSAVQKRLPLYYNQKSRVLQVFLQKKSVMA